MREFIKSIAIKKIKKMVSVEDSIIKEIIAVKEAPILFENIENYNIRIVAGLISTRDTLALSVGVKAKNLSDRVGDAYDKPGKLNEVKTAPFLKNHFKNPDVENHIPIPAFLEGKKYLTASIVHALHPVTKRRNASIHRMMYVGGNKFAIRPVPQRDLDNYYKSALELGEEFLDIIVIIGVHPAIELGAATSFPELDELEFAASLMGGIEEYKLNGIGVPANSEIVMVGKMLKKQIKEGPFVDLTGTLDKIRMQPEVEITDLYMRDDAIFRLIMPGLREHKMLMGIPQEPRIKEMIKNTLPTVKQVVMTEGGGSWLHAVVQIKKRTDGDGKNAIIAALAAHPSLKRVVIIDEDVNPADPVDVEWAIATRFQPDKDMVLVPNAKGSSLDPSAGENSATCKWGLDCTKPLNTEGYDKVV